MQMPLNVELNRNNFYMIRRGGLVGRKTWLVGAALLVVMAGCFSFSAVGQASGAGQAGSTGQPGHTKIGRASCRERVSYTV